MANAQIENILAAVPLFAGLSRRGLKKLAGLAEPADYMQGAAIIKPGEPGDRLFIALTGQAKVLAPDGSVLHTIMPGEHFGEIALLDGGPRTARVESETPMTLLLIRREPFLEAVTTDPELATSLLASLAQMIRRIDPSLDR